MKSFETSAFEEAFAATGIREGDTLLVHNSLLRFGRPTDVALSRLPEAIFERLQARLGDSGTICVPTFNFDFCKGIAFNRQESPSKNMGVFSEFVRQLPGAQRSRHPMQSLAAVGAQADYLSEPDTESSFSPDGPFDRLKTLDGKILLLGADFNSTSMIHWAEERLPVPYRYWKEFTADYVDHGQLVERTYAMYVRSMETNPLLKLYAIERELVRQQRLQEAPVGGGSIKVFGIGDFLDIAMQFLKRNPYYFVSNHPQFEQ